MGKIYRFPMSAYSFLGFVYPETRPYWLRHERELKRSIESGMTLRSRFQENQRIISILPLRHAF